MTRRSRRFHKLCDVLGLPELKDDPRFATNALRVINRDELLPVLAERLKTKATADWLPPLVKVGLPAAKVNNVQEAFDSPQAQARRMVEEVDCDVAKTGKVRLVGASDPLQASRRLALIRSNAQASQQNSRTRQEGSAWLRHVLVNTPPTSSQSWGTPMRKGKTCDSRAQSEPMHCRDARAARASTSAR